MSLEVFYVTAGIACTQQFLDMGFNHLMMSAYSITKQSAGCPNKMALMKGTTWILDSGMISAWRNRDPAWANRQDHIAALARKHHPSYVSHLDMPVERHFLQTNHISKADALESSYQNALMFLDADVDGAKKIFVLQGWDIDDYQRCFRDFDDAGILDACESDGHWLGVGTMCLRKPTQGIFQICESIRRWTGGIHLHVFGVGQKSYQKRLDQIGIDSTDTASFMLNNMVFGGHKHEVH